MSGLNTKDRKEGEVDSAKRGKNVLMGIVFSMLLFYNFPLYGNMLKPASYKIEILILKQSKMYGHRYINP